MPIDRSKFKRSKAIAVYSQYILFEFREVEAFIFEMDNVLNTKVGELSDFAKTMIDSSNAPDTRDDFIDQLLEDRYQLETTFKQMLYVNTFISVFAMFENALQGACRHSLGTLFKVHSRNIIVSYKKNLEETFDISLDFGIWGKILMYREARNHLVHNSFQLTGSREKQISPALKEFLKQTGGIKFKSEIDFIVSHKSFIDSFNKVAQEYLKKAFNVVVPLSKETT